MSGVLTAVSETPLSILAGEASSVRWLERDQVFEIRSGDKELLDMALKIFAARSPDVTASTTRHWTVERVDNHGDSVWLVSGSSEISSMIPARSETRENALLRIELDALDWLLHNAADAVTVHAALLAKNGRGIVIVGPSFAGKSTLATALWRAGWSLMSDDLVFIDVEKGTASPAPRRVSLRYESKNIVGEPTWSEISETPSCIETEKGLFFHPHEVSGIDKMSVTPLSAIFFLARREIVLDSAEVRGINPAKAALALLPYAFNVRTLPFVKALRRITPLLEWIPAFDMGRGDINAMVNAVEASVV